MVRMLIDAGADPTLQNVDGRTALMFWCDSSCEPEMNCGPEHPAFRDPWGVVEHLIRGGAPVDAVDRRGWTALMMAISWGEWTVAAALLEGGADVGVRGPEGTTALHQLAIWTADHQCLSGFETMIRLLRRGASLEVRDDLGRTPELAASEIEDPEGTLVRLMSLHDRFMRDTPDAPLIKLAPQPLPSHDELPEVDPEDPLANIIFDPS